MYKCHHFKLDSTIFHIVECYFSKIINSYLHNHNLNMFFLNLIKMTINYNIFVDKVKLTGKNNKKVIYSCNR